MTVNIYDDVNRLEATLRKTDEFHEVTKAIEEVKEDQAALELFKSFRQIQVQLQDKQMRGEEISSEELEGAQQTAQLAQQNDKIMNMLQAEMKLSNLIEEMNRVLLKPVQALYETIS